MMGVRKKIALWLCPQLDPLAVLDIRGGNRVMDNDIHNQLIQLSVIYAKHQGITHWRVSYLARKDGQFFKRLNDGGSCTIKTAKKVLEWFSFNWPDDLEWPADIERPAKTSEAA